MYQFLMEEFPTAPGVAAAEDVHEVLRGEFQV
jgi:hypothetical protein